MVSPSTTQVVEKKPDYEEEVGKEIRAHDLQQTSTYLPTNQEAVNAVMEALNNVLASKLLQSQDAPDLQLCSSGGSLL